ncbi:CopD family protein [Sphingobium sp. AS12]|uniref:CopD family protein n=1 Tax=Sphingobium sp. AS12 TaxID=2849495 RepID=UPI0020C91567|nr:CopD family protein [Sphingobium sp. AS12]
MRHALFTAMLAMATSNRFRLTPALEVGFDSGANQVAVARLRRRLWADAAAGVVILGLVGWLGSLSRLAAADEWRRTRAHRHQI